MERVKVNRNFCNKLWNAARFLEPKMVTSGGVITQEELAGMPLFERYIISEAHACAEASASALEDYSIGDAGTRAYRFFYDEFADWYVEVSKTRCRGPGRVAAGLVVFLRVCLKFTSLRAARHGILVAEVV